MDEDKNTLTPFTQGHAEMLRDIHGALVGNPKLGNPGLVARVAIVETQVATHDRKIWLATIIGGGLWAGVVAYAKSKLTS